MGNGRHWYIVFPRSHDELVRLPFIKGVEDKSSLIRVMAAQFIGFVVLPSFHGRVDLRFIESAKRG
jgi:hypothetical protein